jgi:4-hydroxy-4-methyl-2-oxoglutarate aldolase
MLDLVQDHIVVQFKKLSTSAVADSLDKHGREGACLGITPLDPNFAIVGRAYTVKYEPCSVEKGTVGDYIDDVPAGYVVVLDNSGRKDCTVWGDILTTVSFRKSLAGTVVNGVCRDTKLSLDLQYPIFSSGKYMRTGKDRVQVEGVNVPVSLADIRVNPGDIIIGDSDGIVVVPQEIEEKVLRTAQEIEAVELQIRLKAEQGRRLSDVRKDFNYHKIQRG